MEMVTIPTRIFFEKTGRAKYISHLDMSRAFQRSFKRSGLPLWYTQGFHPHLYLTFGLPISLGYESLCESVDVKFTQEVEPEEILRRLGEALPEGLRAYGVGAPVRKADEITSCDFTVTLRFPGMGWEGVGERFSAFLAQETLVVSKRSKKGTKDVDIRPYIQLLSIEGEGESLRLLLRLAAGNAMNVNPALVVDAFCEWAQLPKGDMDVLRRQLYTADGKIFA